MTTRANASASAAPALTVRPAKPDEITVIRDLLAAAYAPYAHDVSPEASRRFRADVLDLDRHACDGELLVATIDGRVAGYVAFYPDASVQGTGWPTGWAGGRGLAVAPQYRGYGIAAALMAELERRAREAGAPMFAFHTSGFMSIARALYERLGYRRAPEFDIDMNAHYDVDTEPAWQGLAYLKCLSAVQAA